MWCVTANPVTVSLWSVFSLPPHFTGWVSSPHWTVFREWRALAQVAELSCAPSRTCTRPKATHIYLPHLPSFPPTYNSGSQSRHVHLLPSNHTYLSLSEPPSLGCTLSFKKKREEILRLLLAAFETGEYNKTGSFCGFGKNSGILVNIVLGTAQNTWGEGLGAGRWEGHFRQGHCCWWCGSLAMPLATPGSL